MSQDEERRRQIAAENRIPEIYRFAEGRLTPAERRRLRAEKISPLKKARKMYAENFRRSHGDVSIDIEINSHFDEWLSESVPLIIRPDLVLALLLREGFAGRGRGQQVSNYERRSNSIALDRYKRLRAEEKRNLINEGKSNSYAAREAQYRAAKAISMQSGLSIKAILGGRPNRLRQRKKT